MTTYTYTVETNYDTLTSDGSQDMAEATLLRCYENGTEAWLYAVDETGTYSRAESERVENRVALAVWSRGNS